ncbi:hypothetical protein STEG23_000089, partial [Scotinomys teguina]
TRRVPECRPAVPQGLGFSIHQHCLIPDLWRAVCGQICALKYPEVVNDLGPAPLQLSTAGKHMKATELKPQESPREACRAVQFIGTLGVKGPDCGGLMPHTERTVKPPYRLLTLVTQLLVLCNVHQMSGANETSDLTPIKVWVKTGSLAGLAPAKLSAVSGKNPRDSGITGQGGLPCSHTRYWENPVDYGIFSLQFLSAAAAPHPSEEWEEGNKATYRHKSPGSSTP